MNDDLAEYYIKRTIIVSRTGGYVAIICFLIISVTGVLASNDFVHILLRALAGVAVAWPVGSLIGYLAFNILYENEKPQRAEDAPAEEIDKK